MKKAVKMEVVSDNFISINSNIHEIMNMDKDLNVASWQDPLKGVQNEIHDSQYYRMDRVVFAEPMNSLTTEENNLKEESQEQYSEMIFIDNVTVEKRKGKKNKKYHIDVDSTSPICPQPNCNRPFSTMTLLKAHIRKTHCADSNAYVCERCGAAFKSQFTMKRHSAVHDERKVKCGECGVMLSARTNMSQHLRSHSNTRQHECHLCHKRFIRKSTLNVHVKFVHRNGGLKCDKCDARFESRSQLSEHSSTHRQRATKI